MGDQHISGGCGELLPCPFCGGQVAMTQKGEGQLTIKCGCNIQRTQKVLRQPIDWLRQKMTENWNSAPRPGAPAQAAAKHDHRVYFACQCCEEHAPENGVNCREDIGIMPDGTWLCHDCYSDCDKSAHGMIASDVGDFEFQRFEDLPRPAAYAHSSTHHSSPVATIGDIPSEPRPPASAAMGLSAGNEPIVRYIWPAGCHSPNSCRQNERCMYVGCKHDGTEAMKAAAASSTEGK